MCRAAGERVGTMRHGMASAVLAGVFVLVAGAAQAGPIQKACLKSDRSGVSREMCGCIQGVADATLSGADQKRVARFFNDPEEAHRIKLSDTRSNEAFWSRYMAFGAAAEESCARE